MRSPDGVDLALYTDGPQDAPVVLAVHGYPDDHTVWSQVVPLLADDYRVVTYDVRGAGRSGEPTDPGGYRTDRLVADLLAVADAVTADSGGGPVHLLAHDWGSVQAWQAVSEHPDRFASFTSISGPHLAHLARFRGKGRLRQLAKSWYIGFFQLPRLPELAWRSGVAGGAIARREGVPVPATRDGINGLELYRANIGGSHGEGRTTVPTQVLAPTRDRYLTTELLASAPGVRLREIAGGHWLPRERPDVVARCVRELIAEVGDSRVRNQGLAGIADPTPTSPPLPTRESPTSDTRVPRSGHASRTSRWSGKIVLVTGAASGIGKAVAEGFTARGATVVGVDRAPGCDFQVDVSDAAAMEKLADDVCARVGVPDVVVNNAGIAVSGPFLAHSAQDWQDIVDVNLMGVVHGCRLFAARMVERGEGGHLVNVASAAAFTPTSFLPAYCTTKSAVLMLSECLRAELAAHDIGVTALCPGFLPTNIGASARFVGVDDAAAEQRRVDRLLKRRPYRLEKVADAVITAVERNRPVQLLTVESRIARVLPPAVLRRVARLPVPNL
ncbi:SDR family oxidoreductase [Pseudonocardia sp. WMMC193]|uniref:SDR family oxidoreductase n=1 Tax=Pseudonocardia sp. WMMC193 TaxID=2911965 RepID=UPI001F01304C|nr:SDR family oxidoreductase [Pseudonocardia sp. WMMC193]MCF7552450.1 SDR family oxidoreductase [Pseudonocardia sp. WMMC193]